MRRRDNCVFRVPHKIFSYPPFAASLSLFLRELPDPFSARDGSRSILGSVPGNSRGVQFFFSILSAFFFTRLDGMTLHRYTQVSFFPMVFLFYSIRVARAGRY